jgi:glycosyltransferase involved in cell wall biosynthesis
VGVALQSILDQDYPGRLEALAVDDRSTDRTGEIAAGLAEQRPGRVNPLWARRSTRMLAGQESRALPRYRGGRRRVAALHRRVRPLATAGCGDVDPRSTPGICEQSRDLFGRDGMY